MLKALLILAIAALLTAGVATVSEATPSPSAHAKKCKPGEKKVRKKNGKVICVKKTPPKPRQNDFTCQIEAGPSQNPNFTDDDEFDMRCPVPDVNEIKIGPGMPGFQSLAAGLPITRISKFAVFGPGVFYTGDCTLASGTITCPLSPPMNSDQTFAVAFGPKLPSGTVIGVEVRTQSGKLSQTNVAVH